MAEQQKRYTIHADLKQQVGLETIGLPGQNHPRLRIVLQGEITPEEYRTVFGPDANIVNDMCLETTGSDNYTIRVELTDVLAFEQDGDSHQGELIKALLKQEGLEELDQKEMSEQAKRIEEISPEAAQIILNTAEGGVWPDEVDLEWAVKKALEQGMSWADFLNEE